MTPTRRVTYLVPPEHAGQRLDVFLSNRDIGLSRSQLQRLIEKDLVLVNGRGPRASARLRDGDSVQVEVPPPEPATAQPEKLPLEILHEDKDLIVVVKPAGMVVHPAAGVRSGTLVNALLFHCDDLGGIGGTLRPGIVHRLDKGTTGVMVAAKNDAAHTGLAAQFKDHSIHRRYLALVWGRVQPPQGTIETWFGRHPRARTRFTSKGEGGKRAVTHYQVTERFGQFSLLGVRLETGRTHQIRVHLSERAHPVVGDPTYGRGRLGATKGALREALRGLGRQMLHAAELGFDHPRTGEQLRFQAPLPEDFDALVRLLRAEMVA